MPRPTIQIAKPNKLADMRAHLDRLLPRFSALPGVVGITLNGGLSRGYADHLSEIDITFFLDSDAYRAWRNGQAPHGTGIQVIDDLLYDLKVTNIDQAIAAAWSDVALWDLSYAEILYDPSGRVAALIAEKLAAKPSPLDAGRPLFSAWWYFKLATDIWIYREDVLQGHSMLNHALMELVKAVFLANGEYVPHEKWLIHLSRSLDWQPANWNDRLTQALCDLIPTLDGLRQRQQRIEQLWTEIDRFVVDTYVPDHPLSLAHKPFYDLMVLLVEKSPLPLDQWQEHTNLETLNWAPFNACTLIEDDCVVLDYEKSTQLTEDDLHAWHYQIVEAIGPLLDQET